MALEINMNEMDNFEWVERPVQTRSCIVQVDCPPDDKQ